MTNEEKELLLKDLCSRLPFGVKCMHQYGCAKLVNIDIDEDDVRLCFDTPDDNDYPVDGRIKPYLRPMSSMTEEDEHELNSIKRRMRFDEEIYLMEDFFYKKHLDIRHLIEKGLALEAPEGMYNN